MLALSDEELILQCQFELPDSTTSFEILVQRYNRQVFNRVYRLLGDREEAEDVTQEVFIKVFYNLKKIAQPATFPGWINRIATNSALNTLEKLKTRPAKAYPNASSQNDGFREDADWQHLQEAANGPATADSEQHFIKGELHNCIGEVFMAMEREKATLLVMRDVDNLSYDEVAVAMGVSLSAIKMRIHRARVTFQEVFRKICSSWDNFNQTASSTEPKIKIEHKIRNPFSKKTRGKEV